MADENKSNLVAYCGLFCGGCGSYKKGRCKKGCKDGGGFAKCKVRICAVEREYQSCAECDELLDCKKLNNFISKVMALIFRSDRKGNLRGIKEMGIERWAEERAASGKK